VEGGESLGESLIVSGQPAESRSPGEASLDHPAARQQDETALCLGVFDHLQLDAVPSGRALGGFSGVTLHSNPGICSVRVFCGIQIPELVEMFVLKSRTETDARKEG
jgi:hypothetical protein